jgi:putative oxidoreductase
VTKQSMTKAVLARIDALRTRLGWAAPLLGRITLGGLFTSTGWGKVHHLDKVTAFFTELGIPAPAFQATLVSYVELIGGALLLVGLLTEFAAVPLIVSMAVAIITAKRNEVHGLPDLFGLVEWTYLVMLVWVAIEGAGACSIDRLWRGVARRRPKAPHTPGEADSAPAHSS